MATDAPQTMDPRVVRSRERIMAATLDEVVERGYVGLTIESIASRAGVSKATIYRHWPTRAELLSDVFEWAKPPVFETPDTGSVRTDVIAILDQLVAVVNGEPSSFLPVLMDAAERDPELASHHRGHTRARRQPLINALQAGIARGELPPTVDVDLLADLLGAPIMYRRFVSRQGVDRDLVRRLVDTVLPHASGSCRNRDDA